MATQQTNQDFEARQLLKAYRKGLISDSLFEEQMGELGNGNGAGRYVFGGKSYDTEREMLVAFLDEYRCAENYAADYFNCWSEVSDQACVKGGLLAVQQRESFHAQLLEARLRELGGSPQCSVPTEQREKDMALYASTDKNDAEKLSYVTSQFPDLTKALRFITDVIDQIQDDQHSKELLRSLVQDEMSSGNWLIEACQMLNGEKAAA